MQIHKEITIISFLLRDGGRKIEANIVNFDLQDHSSYHFESDLFWSWLALHRNIVSCDWVETHNPI